MRLAHFFIGIVLLFIIAAVYYFISYNGNDRPQTLNESNSMLAITSPAFESNATIPSKFTCDAENVSPPLFISGIPEGTVSLVILMDDPDVPKVLRPDGMFDHWVVYSVPIALGQTSLEVAEGTAPGPQGLNGRGVEGYTGPCPPPEYEPTEHRYFFKVYALGTEITFFKTPTKAEVETVIQSHVIASTELVGRYDRLPQHGSAQ